MQLYAVTTESDPSQVLNLFDVGFDDVFSLPRDIDIVAARLRKAIQDVPETEAPRPRNRDASRPRLPPLAFTDLLQALSQSQKSVCIRLTRSNGEQAVIHLQNGNLVHGISGKLKGSDAIYRVIAWEEDGEYSVEPAEEFPGAQHFLAAGIDSHGGLPHSGRESGLRDAGRATVKSRHSGSRRGHISFRSRG